MHTIDDTTDATPLAWRVDAWLRAAGHPFAKDKMYREIHVGRIETRKAGRNTIITTSPADYIAALPRGVNPPSLNRSRWSRRAK
jgi:hypothetical protein